MPSPLITLITVVYNAAPTIERALQSIRAQTHDNIEYIVLDGASDDGTQDIIEQYKDIITLYRSRPDKGPNYALNEAFSMAKGELVGLISSDDWLEPHALSTLAEMFVQHPEAEMFCYNLQEHGEDEQHQLVPTRRFTDHDSETFSLEDGMYCQGLNRFYHRSVLRDVGMFNPDSWPYLADRDFYVRCGLKGLKKAYRNETLYHFVVHDGSRTSSGNLHHKVMLLKETLRIAADYLRPGRAESEHKQLLARWYCFNAVRLAYFQLQQKRMHSMFSTLVSAFSLHPKAFIGIMINPHMPEPYRAKEIL